MSPRRFAAPEKENGAARHGPHEPPQLERLDRRVFPEPPAPSEPLLPQHRHSDDRGRCRPRPPRAFAFVARRSPRALHGRLALAVRGPRLRAQAAGIRERLAVLLRRSEVVVLENARPRLKPAIAPPMHPPPPPLPPPPSPPFPPPPPPFPSLSH